MARFETIRRRRDFVAASRARRAGAESVNLQGRDRGEAEPTDWRVGFTCSKKLGGAVRRNRAKRRLREAAAIVLPELGRPGWDYVLVGRPDTTESLPFARLVADLSGAMARVHAPKRARPADPDMTR